MRLRNICFSVVMVVALVLAVPAFAQQVRFDGAMVDANAVPKVLSAPSVVNPPGNAPEWGTSNWSTYEAGPCDAMLRQGSWTDGNCHYLLSTSTADLDVGLPVHLPSGANAQWVRIYFNETNLSQGISAGFWKTTEFGVGSDIQGMSTTATTDGDTYQEWGPFSEVIDNSPSTGYTYAFLAITEGTTKIYKMMVYYTLQVSPAPATATFTDVPVGAFGFQHIEALVASGITAGCGGGNFCPNAYVTRAQMAVFLAKAFGLNYYY